MSEIVTPVREPAPDPDAARVTGGPPRYFALWEAAPGVLLAGTCGRGIARSVDGGTTWSTVDGAFADGNVNGFATGHDGELYAACGTAGVFVSHDSGEHWAAFAVGLDTGMGEVYCVAAVGRELLAGTAHGVFARSDGDQWSYEDGGPSGAVYRLTVLDGGALAAATETDGVWVRLPGGVWRSLRLRDVPVFAVVPLDGGDLLAGTRGRGVMRWCRDEGGWRDVAEPPRDAIVHTIERTADGALVAGTGQGVVIAGSDGEHWSPVGDSLANHRIFSLLVDGHGATVAGSYEGVWTWPAGGSEWAPIDTGLDVGALFAIGVDGDVVYVGGPAGAFRSDDRGESWEPVRPVEISGNVYAFHRTTDGLLVGTDDGVWNAGGGLPGEPWRRAGLEGIRVFTMVDRDPGHVLAGTLGKGLWSRPGADAQWHRCTEGLDDELAFDLARSARSGDLFVATGSVRDGFKAGGIYRSRDGERWEPVELEATTVYDVIETQSGVIVGGAQRSRILRSEDGGRSFTTTRPHRREDSKMYSLSLDGADRLYLGAGPELLRSDDAGLSWEVVGRGLDGVTVYGIVDTAGTLVAATSSGVFRSTDAGVNWTPASWNR